MEACARQNSNGMERSVLLMQFAHGPVFTGGAILLLTEDPVKGRYAGKTGTECNLCDRQIRLSQQAFGNLQPLETQVVVEGGIRELLEQSGEMIFGIADGCGYGFQGQFIHIVFVYVFQNVVELLQIFFLLVDPGAGENVIVLQMVTPQIHEKIHEMGVNDDLPVLTLGEILIPDLHQKTIHIVIDIGIIRFIDPDRLHHKRLNRGKAAEPGDVGHIKQENEPFPGVGCFQHMHLSRRNDQNLAGQKMVLGTVYLHVVIIFHRQDNLQSLMPVGGIRIGLFVEPDPERQVGMIVDNLLIGNHISAPVVRIGRIVNSLVFF